MVEAGKLVILNLRDGGNIKLRFPEQVSSEDAVSYEESDVAGGLAPLSYINSQPQETTLEKLLIGNPVGSDSVEPEIKKLRDWMRPREGEGSPPPLQIVAQDWTMRGVLVRLSTNREFFTPQGVCIRAYLTLTFREIPGLTAQTGGKRLGGVAR